MPLIENKKTTVKGRWILFTTGVILCGLPIWFTSYTQYSNNAIYSNLSEIAGALLVAYIVWNTRHRKRNIVLFVTGAQQVAFFIKFALDTIPDKTNHNLVPFESMMQVAIDLILYSMVALLVAMSKPFDKEQHG
jgi:hypothetical protein